MGIKAAKMSKAGAKKKAESRQPAEEKRAATFNEVSASFVNTVYAVLLGLRGRTGGAQDYGADGLFVCAVEALHTARASKSLEDFLKSAAYSVAAALKAGGAWDYPLAAPEKAEKSAKKKEESDGAK